MKDKIKTILKSIWWVSVLIFIGIFLYKNLHVTAEILRRLPISILLISFFAIFISKLLLALMMKLALEHFQVNLSYLKCFNIYNITQLGKYIPGSIWQFVGRFTLYREEAISNSKIRDTLLLETFWVVFSALIIGATLILFKKSNLFIQLFSMLNGIKTITILLIIISTVFVALWYRYRRVSLNYVKQFLFTYKSVIVAVFIWAVLGYSFWITLSPYTTEQISLIYIIGLYALSYAIGFSVPFAPAGLGVREAILVAGLITYTDMNTAIVLAAINRLLYIICEIILLLISSVTKSTIKQ
ncbi:MAG: lysylphosphatidylglycerol synthase domain-containing protein [Candidatus Thiodiazotropha sp.]